MGQDGETSVEEILASIKQVMNRDRPGSTGVGGERHAAGNSSGPAPRDPSLRSPSGAGASSKQEPIQSEPAGHEPASDEEADEILDLADMELGHERSDERFRPGAGDSPLVTDAVRGAMQQNLDALAMISEPGAKPQIVRSGETSLEGLTRELLRPMLAEWLDANLPAMVETMVQAEIARIARKRPQ